MNDSNIVTLLEEAQECLSSHQNAELLLSIRQGIWRALGPRIIDRAKRATRAIGHIRRARLATLCTSHVLSFWIRSFANDRLPQRILDTAQSYLTGRVTFRNAKQLYDDGWVLCENTMAGLSQRASNRMRSDVFVGFAAVQTLRTALFDEQFPANGPIGTRKDMGLEPFAMDASFLASIVAAGDFPGGRKGSQKKRRDFWRWYLSTAVPTVWQESLLLGKDA